jgi:hypothetical protein
LYFVGISVIKLCNCIVLVGLNVFLSFLNERLKDAAAVKLALPFFRDLGWFG